LERVTSLDLDEAFPEAVNLARLRSAYLKGWMIIYIKWVRASKIWGLKGGCS
jgi:hypothetical protein